MLTVSQTILIAALMELKTHNVQSLVTKFKHSLQLDLNQLPKHQDHSQLKDPNLSLPRDHNLNLPRDHSLNLHKDHHLNLLKGLNLSQQIPHNLVQLNHNPDPLNLALLHVHTNQILIPMSMSKMRLSSFHLHALPL